MLILFALLLPSILLPLHSFLSISNSWCTSPPHSLIRAHTPPHLLPRKFRHPSISATLPLQSSFPVSSPIPSFFSLPISKFYRNQHFESSLGRLFLLSNHFTTRFALKPRTRGLTGLASAQGIVLSVFYHCYLLCYSDSGITTFGLLSY